MPLTAKVKSYWNRGISYTLINSDIMYIHLHWRDPHKKPRVMGEAFSLIQNLSKCGISYWIINTIQF